MLAIGKVEK